MYSVITFPESQQKTTSDSTSTFLKIQAFGRLPNFVFLEVQEHNKLGIFYT